MIEGNIHLTIVQCNGLHKKQYLDADVRQSDTELCVSTQTPRIAGVGEICTCAGVSGSVRLMVFSVEDMLFQTLVCLESDPT